MTTPDVDQELERLFVNARAATMPAAESKARIRASLETRLTAGSTATGKGFRGMAWLGIGAAIVGVCAGALWLKGAPPAAAPARAPLASLPTPPREVPASPPASPPPELTARSPASVAPPALPRRAQPLPAASVPAPAAPVSADGSDELGLVRAMQQALRAGNTSRTLELAAEHARRFPTGTLAEEREGARAVARCRMVAPEERAAIAEAFSRSFGASPYGARVKAACQ